jgi:Tubulin-tyrosine ligase family
VQGSRPLGTVPAGGQAPCKSSYLLRACAFLNTRELPAASVSSMSQQKMSLKYSGQFCEPEVQRTGLQGTSAALHGNSTTASVQVLQEYVPNLQLLHGRKCHVRAHVLVTGAVQVHFAPEHCLVLSAAAPFSAGAGNDPRVHATNFAVCKQYLTSQQPSAAQRESTCTLSPVAAPATRSKQMDHTLENPGGSTHDCASSPERLNPAACHVKAAGCAGHPMTLQQACKVWALERHQGPAVSGMQHPGGPVSSRQGESTLCGDTSGSAADQPHACQGVRMATGDVSLNAAEVMPTSGAGLFSHICVEIADTLKVPLSCAVACTRGNMLIQMGMATPAPFPGL